MKINGNLITSGLGKKRLYNASISPIRMQQYIVSDWDYEDVFTKKLQNDTSIQFLNIDSQQFLNKINSYILYSKKHKRLPTVSRIIDFFDKRIDEQLANKIYKLIVIKKKREFEYDMPMFCENINDIQNANVMLISKESLIKLIKLKKIEYKCGCMYFNNIRIVENKLNTMYNVIVFTNEKKLRVVYLKNGVILK